MSKQVSREYVSKHVYRTPSGAYWDDRRIGAARRLTNRRGAASERAAERMAARIRDEHGVLAYRRVKANADYRPKGKKHTGSPDNDDFEADTIYDQDKNEELAAEYIRKNLNKEHPDEDHFNISDIVTLED